MREELSESDLAAFAPSEKIGIVATVTEAGEPHLTILTTLMGKGAKELTIGEFSRGQGKENMAKTGKVGFLVMGLDRRLWRGKARWRRSAKDGPEYVAYNRQPMFRYNTYFGINTVHYLDLIGIEGPRPLPMGAIVIGSLATAVAAPFAHPRGTISAGRKAAEGEAIMPPPALRLLDTLDSLSFLGAIDADGFPRVIPIVQARSAGSRRIVFTPGAWRQELLSIPMGTRVAILSMNLGMESFVSRGRLLRTAGLLGVDLDWLYNSAPPCHGQVYPPRPLEAFISP